MSEHYVAFKAVSFRDDGKIYSLGMGQAKVVPFPVGRWAKRREGIAAGKTVSKAKRVIYIAKQRKTLPIPPDMRVVKILGKGIKFESSWRIIFAKIMIIPALTSGTSFRGEWQVAPIQTEEELSDSQKITSDRKIDLIRDILSTYKGEVKGYLHVMSLERAERVLRDIDDIVRREW